MLVGEGDVLRIGISLVEPTEQGLWTQTSYNAGFKLTYSFGEYDAFFIFHGTVFPPTQKITIPKKVSVS